MSTRASHLKWKQQLNCDCFTSKYTVIRNNRLRTYKMKTHLPQRLQQWSFNEVNQLQIPLRKTIAAAWFQRRYLPASSAWMQCARAGDLTHLRLPVTQMWPRKQSMASARSKLVRMLQTSANSSRNTSEILGFEV